MCAKFWRPRPLLARETESVTSEGVSEQAGAVGMASVHQLRRDPSQDDSRHVRQDAGEAPRFLPQSERMSLFPDASAKEGSASGADDGEGVAGTEHGDQLGRDVL